MIKAVLNFKKKQKNKRYSVLDLICELKQSTYSLGGTEYVTTARRGFSAELKGITSPSASFT